MELDVRPGDGIGPIGIGMTRLEVLEVIAASGLVAAPFRRGLGEGRPDLAVNGHLFAYFGSDGLEEAEQHVEQVESRASGAAARTVSTPVGEFVVSDLVRHD